MPDAVNLDAYLRRVDWAGPVAADLATLRGLAIAHVARIPFANLDPDIETTVRVLHHVRRVLDEESSA